MQNFIYLKNYLIKDQLLITDKDIPEYKKILKISKKKNKFKNNIK